MLDRRLLTLVFAGLAVCLLAGCPQKKPKYPACTGDKDCKAGQFCVNKTCVQCRDDGDCGDGMSCQSGMCEVAKDACTTEAQCAEGEVCKDGACSACASNDECGPGGKCQAGVCDRPKACNVDEDCADDEDCIEGRCLQPWKTEAPDLSCQLQTVYFQFDEAVIPDDARGTLQENATCVLQAPTNRGVTLVGHADESGTEEYNIALSERRARAILNFLKALGIDEERMRIVPRGESEPSGEGPERDRRVEFQWQ